jgi:farnesyl diphosphate synthase
MSKRSSEDSSAAPPAVPPTKKAKEAQKQLFLSVFDKLKNLILEEMPTAYEMPQAAVDWVAKMVPYTVEGGKMVRGLTVLSAATVLAGDTPLTEQQQEEACVVGWCIEWLQAFFLVEDDIMDDSVKRRGQDCWYRRPEVGLVAINDGFLLQSHIYRILKKYFGGKGGGCYLQLIELFNEVTYQTELGQLLDLTSQPPGETEPQLHLFTEERYYSIVKYKTAFYTFFLPVASAMILHAHASGDATMAGAEAMKEAREVCMEMGTYFQVQDDYLDCYADPEVLGKVGRDIEEAKCGWLVVQALKVVTPEQKQVLVDHYGKEDPAGVAKVKQLYKDLEIEAKFHAYEAESYKRITAHMDKLDKVHTGVFTELLAKIYKRTK